MALQWKFWVWAFLLLCSSVSRISLMYVSPLQNPRWEWIQRAFKCSASCVLCVKVTDREYFLIGEDRSVGWFLTGSTKVRWNLWLSVIAFYCIVLIKKHTLTHTRHMSLKTDTQECHARNTKSLGCDFKDLRKGIILQNKVKLLAFFFP